jgi:hypothetical protein
LEQRRASILDQISSLGDLRPGTLRKKYLKCGTPSCHCHHEGDPGHGPYFVLLFYRDGKKTSRSIPAAHAARTQAQVGECRRLRRLTGALINVSEQLCNARLELGTDTPNEREKKPARRNSSPRSRPRLPGS